MRGIQIKAISASTTPSNMRFENWFSMADFTHRTDTYLIVFIMGEISKRKKNVMGLTYSEKRLIRGNGFRVKLRSYLQTPALETSDPTPLPIPQDEIFINENPHNCINLKIWWYTLGWLNISTVVIWKVWRDGGWNARSWACGTLSSHEPLPGSHHHHE